MNGDRVMGVVIPADVFLAKGFKWGQEDGSDEIVAYARRHSRRLDHRSIPDDAQVVGVQWSIGTITIIVAFKHPDFPARRRGECIPLWLADEEEAE